MKRKRFTRAVTAKKTYQYGIQIVFDPGYCNMWRHPVIWISFATRIWVIDLR